jgi:NTE family protein
MKTALVLSGGGFKGAFQVGALQYLRDHWGKINPAQPKMKFDIVAGVSVGALNGLLVATDKFDDLVSLWQRVGENGVSEIYDSDFIDTRPDQGNPNPKLKIDLSWSKIRKMFPTTTKNIFLKAIFNRKAILNSFKEEFQHLKSLADNTPLKNKLIRFAKRDEISGCIYKCGYVSLNDGKYYASNHTDFVSDEDFANGVLASTVMPIIWKPVESIATKMGIQRSLVDGGIRDVTPLGDVIREISANGSNEEFTIIIINCSSGKITPEDYLEKNIAQIAVRSLVDIAITEIFNHDIKEFVDKNYILQQVRAKFPGEQIYDFDYEHGRQGKPLKYFNTIIIQPDEDRLGDSLTANKILIDYRIKHGHVKAELALERHQPGANV